MKKIIITIILIVVPILSFGQTSIFDKLEKLDDVTTVVVTKDAFALLKNMPDTNTKDMDVFSVTKGLKSLKVFTTTNKSIVSQMEAMVNSQIKNAGLTELMRVKDKGSRVKIYVKSSGNKQIVNEVLMFVKDKNTKDGKSESIIVSLLGKIDINKLSKIAENYSKD